MLLRGELQGRHEHHAPHFLTRAATMGGASLVYEPMTGLGLLASPTQTPFDLSGRAPGTRVLFLGAGLTGLTVAYELAKAGYACRVLEARPRPGGRVFTVRCGTVSEEDGPRQTAAFDDGLYFNADRCAFLTIIERRWNIQEDLSQPVQAAISASSYDGAGKIGLQFKRRFWEEDDHIHGGRSWTDQEIGQIIYPSHGFLERKGILVGYYLDFKRTMRERSAAECQRLALEQGAPIHPQYTTAFEMAFSVSWPRVPWNRGSWRSEMAAAHKALAVLREPDGRVYFAGDYMTNMSSRMQGRSNRPAR